MEARTRDAASEQLAIVKAHTAVPPTPSAVPVQHAAAALAATLATAPAAATGPERQHRVWPALGQSDARNVRV
eukprot:SAG31_NODE_34203_length_335_cov_1.063559_1_plen_72_part_10